MSASLTSVLIAGSAMIANGSNFTLDKKFSQLWNFDPPIGEPMDINKVYLLDQANPDVLLLRSGSSVKLALTPDVSLLAPEYQGFYVHSGLIVEALFTDVLGNMIKIRDLRTISVSDKSTQMYYSGTILKANMKLKNHAILCDRNNPFPVSIGIDADGDLIIPLPGKCQIKVSLEVDFVPDID